MAAVVGVSIEPHAFDIRSGETYLRTQNAPWNSCSFKREQRCEELVGDLGGE